MVRMPIELADLDAAWLAGLLEGEGSFMRAPPSDPRRPIVALSMTDEDVVQRAARLMANGHYARSDRRPGKWKPTFRVFVKGAPAVELMRALRPLMGTRRQAQIDAALASFRSSPDHPNNKRYDWPSDEELLELRRTMSWRQLAARIGCTHTAVRRRVFSILRKLWCREGAGEPGCL